jgi:hypothetical protein
VSVHRKDWALEVVVFSFTDAISKAGSTVGAVGPCAAAAPEPAIKARIKAVRLIEWRCYNVGAHQQAQPARTVTLEPFEGARNLAPLEIMLPD